ncbi:hypothetical protein RND81_01G102000 [Saponaria officinalis]|uniref:Protein PHLOEM PROTEIN 2-LIKE A10 n=1 Tax=Saponaria officinalis TaxID=3572 RepID=A0AAW1N6U6_SAPOF
MDLLLLSKGLDYAKKRKKWVFLLALFGVSSYGVYKVYNLPNLTRKRKRMLNLFRVLFSVAEMVSDSAETIGLVSKDLKEFLGSDSDEIPNSLKQISKIVRSDEFSDSVTRVSESLSVGILRGYARESSDQGELGGNSSFANQVIEKILSNAGTGFASVVAGSIARNLVLGFYASGASAGGSDGNRMASGLSSSGEFSSMSKWVDLIFDNKCKELMTNCIQVFVSTAVAVYLDKTLHINTYDEVFAGLTNPNHESKVQELIVSVCNGAVETFVKTSHHVLTSKAANSDPSFSTSDTAQGECSDLNGGQFGDGTEVATHMTGDHLLDKAQSSGWGGMVLSTLSVPRNQRFVFHVTGRVTFETFRSFVEFMLWKLSEGLRTGGNVVHDHVIDKGRRVVRFFGLKSFVFVTICLALFLHIASGTRAFLPA